MRQLRKYERVQLGVRPRMLNAVIPPPSASHQEEIATKRSLLFSARLRFSPETQPIRETAIDKIIEQNMLLADADVGLSLWQIQEQGALCFAGGAPAIRQLDMRKSLRRLAAAGRVVVTEVNGDQLYHLSQTAREELWGIEEQTEKRFDRIVARLFRSAGDPTRYVTPFLECLCVIFSRLAETYVRLIKGDSSVPQILDSAVVARIVDETLAAHGELDRQIFHLAVVKFLEERDPEWDLVKWNLAQNYYIAKVLGLDSGGYLLSREILGNATLYLDTNVVIEAIEPRASKHKSFRALASVCQSLGIKLRVCHISVIELRRVIEYYLDVLPRVHLQIPDETAPKIRSVFYQLFRERRLTDETLDLNELFASFLEPAPCLESLYGVEVLDDAWFVRAESEQETRGLVDQLRAPRRRKPKSPRAAQHDALLLRWVEKERRESGANVWLVTLDASLSRSMISGPPGRPVAVTLDALLQWLSPIAVEYDSEDQFAAIFSDAVRNLLLPHDNFFELGDFLMLSELDLSCRELPAPDVEGCLLHLRTRLPELDISNPVHRERLSHEVSKFFADPGRKFRGELVRQEAERQRISTQHRAELTDRDVAIRKRDARIKSLERANAQLEERARADALRGSAIWRLVCLSLGLVVYEACLLYNGMNEVSLTAALSVLVGRWPLVVVGPGLMVVAGWFLLGKDGIDALGWGFRRIFGSEPKASTELLVNRAAEMELAKSDLPGHEPRTKRAEVVR